MNHQNKLTLARSNQLPERIIGNSESSFYRTDTFATPLPDTFAGRTPLPIFCGQVNTIVFCYSALISHRTSKQKMEAAVIFCSCIFVRWKIM
jgi:hypothetical protein